MSDEDCKHNTEEHYQLNMLVEVNLLREELRSVHDTLKFIREGILCMIITYSCLVFCKTFKLGLFNVA